MNYLLPARCSALVLGMICSIALPWNSESAEQALSCEAGKNPPGSRHGGLGDYESAAVCCARSRLLCQARS